MQSRTPTSTSIASSPTRSSSGGSGKRWRRLRKERKAYGTRKYAEGPELAGRRVTLVEDVVSSGKAILNTLSDLRADDVDVLCAVCVSDRQSGGREALAERNLELRPLLTMDDLTTAAC